jgi:hypothetical protein
MPNREKNNPKRLAKGVRGDQKRSRSGRTRKNLVRAKPGSDTGRKVADERELSPLARLMGALQKEKIRFQVIGMSAAIVQGVPGSTRDVDLWIDLPSREYMKVINIALRNGAEFVRNTVVALSDHTIVNFVYQVTGLGSFGSEIRKSRIHNFHGVKAPVLRLESIRKSKLAIKREKDLIHVQQIDAILRCAKEREK